MRLTITTFISLDNVYQGPGAPQEDRDGGFELGGWFVPFVDDDAFGGFIDGIFQQADAFLLGRRTYETFAGHWPNVTDPDDPVASKLNNLPKHVVSTTLRDPQWSGTHVIEGDVVEAVRALKQQEGRELQVHGSGALAHTLIENDLVDVYRFVRVPVILGRGKRLFPESAAPKGLRMTTNETTPSGAALEVYEVVGPPQTGDFTALAQQ